MKITLFIIAIMFTTNSFANEESTCDFSGTESIEQIKMVSNKSFPYQNKPSTKGHVEIKYVNGEVEKLAPQQFVEGSFNQVHYLDKISSFLRPHKRNLVFVQSSHLGDIKISFTCSDINGDVFCQTRSGHQATVVADFNIKNRIYSFKKDSNPCAYEFVSN